MELRFETFIIKSEAETAKSKYSGLDLPAPLNECIPLIAPANQLECSRFVKELTDIIQGDYNVEKYIGQQLGYQIIWVKRNSNDQIIAYDFRGDIID